MTTVENVLAEATPKHQPIPKWEFVIIMALMTSLMALSIDTVLPALPTIGRDLHIQYANHIQLIVPFLFIGFGLGLLVFGPLSDAIGRKKPIYFGGAIFVIGCAISMAAQDLPTMLLGRILQGFGASGPRIVSTALIRDEYHGKAMAKIMSLIMTVFILVPAIAPSFGQILLFFVNWRFMFFVFLCLACIALTWFGLRQPETLSVERRKPYSLKNISQNTWKTLTNRISLPATIVSGLVFGALIGYLSSAQQIFSDVFHDADHFPLYFGTLALVIGGSSFANSRLLNKFGMAKLIYFSLLIMMTVSLSFTIYLQIFGNIPPLIVFLIYLACTFSCVGLLFGNLNAVALEPLGHIAGIASAAIGTLQNIISVTIGVTIGQMYNGSILPLVSGFTLLSICAFICMKFVLHKHISTH
ncbi:MAG: multidrug effflux MFS transporter [Bdellovibrionaceae bacterium]|nr:multidrug effflux MFS transporter [Pseudobdellovibrionaceae bacterium]